MFSFFKHLQEKWNDWCGDRDLELAIRRHLSDQGYYGKTAKLKNVRLVAIKRPGWIQVHRFDATARLQPPESDEETTETQSDAVYHELFGLVRDDARDHVNQVQTFQESTKRKELFALWSENLICLRGAQGLSE